MAVHDRDDRFSFMMRERPDKPRDYGLTMVLGESVLTTGGLNYLDDLLAVNGAWIDWYKFVWSAFPLQPPRLVEEKIDRLNDHDVLSFTGGNFLEAALVQGYEDEFFEALTETSCPGLEVSSTVIDISVAEKARLIEKAVDYGLHVHGEIGRKATGTGGDHLSTATVIEEMEACLDAGADIVVYETEEVATLFAGESDDRERNPRETLRAITDSIGQENILFEVPISTDMHEVLEVSGWFIRNVGADVNLGNVNPYLVSMVEQQRRGIGAYQEL